MAIENQATNAKDERVQSIKNEREALLAEERANRGRSRRQMALEAVNEESVAALEQIFDEKLAAVRSYERQLSGITDPYARQALQDMVLEERTQLIRLAELIEIVEQGPELGRFARSRRQLEHRLTKGNTKSFAYGAGLAILGMLLFPTVKEGLRPVMEKTVRGFMDLTERAQGLVSSVKEDMEDLVAEAEFERLKQSIDSEIDGGDFTEPK